MKKNKIFSFLALIFYTVVPVFLFLSQYSPKESSLPFKISVGSIISLIFVILLLKNFVFKKMFEEWTIEMANLRAQYIATPNDNVLRAWKKRKGVLTVINALPLLLGGACIIIVAKALEKDLIALSGVMSFMLVAIGIGLIFDICAIWRAK